MIELDLLPGGSRSSTSSRQQAVAAAAARSSTGPTFQLGPHESARGAAAVTSFGSATNNNNNNFSTTSLMYFQHPGGTSTSTSTSSNFPPHPHHHLNWAFRPNLIHPSQNLSNLIMAPSTSFSSSCSSSLMMPQLAAGSSYFGHHQFHHQLQPPPVESAAAGPSGLDFRVVNPPRRPQSGIWFTLQASQNQAKEPFLPQISKSFLRIRDGRMTVRLIIKYLVNKLRLDSESEIEITCRGQQLLPFLTLQHVRDNIWGPTVSLLPDFSTTDHIMVLHYARSA
ncbi:hypothetical protein PanWU01x14_213240 [Parasponia andersonii]|uniref:Uncharacterized protein n=1 Tax=Parasponia andersonii TaxID=3476 RepID=A0A2P5BSZ2_PARAD|nr:hypothetical protein PanWU01x14_213240 [Parasponia andersonii]